MRLRQPWRSSYGASSTEFFRHVGRKVDDDTTVMTELRPGLPGLENSAVARRRRSSMTKENYVQPGWSLLMRTRQATFGTIATASDCCELAATRESERNVVRPLWSDDHRLHHRHVRIDVPQHL